MAQTSISGFYPVRKRSGGDHASVKRRKLTDSTRLDIPIVEESSDASSIPITKSVKVTSVNKSQGKAKPRAKKGSRQISKRGAVRTRTKAKEERSIKTLFDIIAQSSTQDANEVSDPSSKACLPTPQSTSQLPASSPGKDKLPASSPSKDKPPASSPGKDKLPASSPGKDKPPGGVSSVCKGTPPHSPSVKTKPPPSPVPPCALSRGAALVELARQKMIDKSPSKDSTHRRTMASRRKLLSGPKPAVVPDSKELSRTEVVNELYKLSMKDLALPTQFEQPVKPRRGSKPSGAPTLREFKSLEVESPKKNASSRVPAHQRFHSLAEQSSPSGDLPLPLNHQLLSDKFHCTDTIVNMLQKRREICTFHKLKRGVQEMSKREFEQRNLAQMKTVYPTAFTFRQEKDIPGCYDSRSKYQLTIQCNTADNGGFLNPTYLIKRRKSFHQKLVSIVKDHHKEFLSKLCPPLKIPDEKVLRWHPEFKLDRLMEVEESDLPQPPITETYSCAADVLKAAQSRLAQRVKDALANTAGSCSKPLSNPSVEPPELGDDPSLRGVSKGLLDKIRAKEAAKAHATITRDPVREKQLEMVSRLPEFVRIIRAFFISEKKAALLWEEVVSKLSESHPSRLAKDRVEVHLHYLCEIVPKWVCLLTIRKKKYLKIDRKADVKGVLHLVQAAGNKLRQ